MKRSNDCRQAEIDFDRGDQLGLLDSVPLETVRVAEGNGSVGVSAATQRAVLRAVDSFCRGSRSSWPSNETIGKVIGRSEKTVRRAMIAIHDQQLVLVEKRPGRTDRLRVNWGELSVRTARQKVDPPKVTPDMVAGTSDMVAGTSDMVAGTSDMVSDEAFRSVEEASISGPEIRTDVRTKNTIQSGGIEDSVARLFDRLGYRGDEGQTLWLAIAAFRLGMIPEDAIGHAVDAVRAMRPNSRVRYFRKCLAERMSLSLDELRELFGGVRILPRCPATRPQLHDTTGLRLCQPRPDPNEMELRKNELIQQAQQAIQTNENPP